MSSYLTGAASTRATPQSEPIPGAGQVPNSAGGYTWALEPLDRLRRFLILGAEGGTYYASERELVGDNVEAVRAALDAHGVKAVQLIVDVSEQGRAPRNDEAIYALAMAAGHDDRHVRATALALMPRVCRTGTHLLQFCEFVQHFRGHGRALNRALGKWYQDKEPRHLAYQLVKYRQRGGWTHADVLRLVKPASRREGWSKLHQTLLDFATGKGYEPRPGVRSEAEAYALAPLDAYRLAQDEQACATPANTAALVKSYGGALPWEALRTEHLNEPEVIEALVPSMPLGALVRQLGRYGAAGALKPMGALARAVALRLDDEDEVKGSRLHPVQVLRALLTYRQGHGERGSLEWAPVAEVVEALDAAFYHAFQNVEPTGARQLLAVDASGSMLGRNAGSYGYRSYGFDNCAGMPELAPLEGAAAMMMATARAGDPFVACAFGTSLTALPVTAGQRLDDVVRTVVEHGGGGTDCALPMLWALDQGLEVDSFVVYTDNETWAGAVHPAQALRTYRQRTGIAARLAVVGMTSTGFTIADPDDRGMLDLVGFDSAAPRLVAEHAAGRL